MKHALSIAAALLFSAVPAHASWLRGLVKAGIKSLPKTSSYPSKTEAQEACQAWSDKGGSFFLKTKEKTEFSFPDRSEWERNNPLKPAAREASAKPVDKYGRTFDTSGFDRYSFAETIAMAKHSTQGPWTWVKNERNLRYCKIERETSQYLGYEYKAKDSDVVIVDLPEKQIQKRFKY